MLRTHRFGPSTLLRGSVLGSDFYPGTGMKPYSTRGITDQLFLIVLGFCLYSKILGGFCSYRLLISKNKGSYHGTLGEYTLKYCSLGLLFNCVLGYFCDPGTARVSVDRVKQGEKFYKSLQNNRKPLRETDFSECKPEENQLKRCKQIFNKRILMLKIHYFTRDYRKPKNTETQLQTGIARNSDTGPELNIISKITQKTGYMSKMELV